MIKRRTRKRLHAAATLPGILSTLAFASAEVVWRRTALMATNQCSAQEYRRMGAEKLAAMQDSAAAIMAGKGPAAALAPFAARAQANAKRLRGR